MLTSEMLGHWRVLERSWERGQGATGCVHICGPASGFSLALSQHLPDLGSNNFGEHGPGRGVPQPLTEGETLNANPR